MEGQNELATAGAMTTLTTAADKIAPSALKKIRSVFRLVRSRRAPEELAREFEPTAQPISTWMKQVERDAGKRTDGPISVDFHRDLALTHIW